MAFKTTKATDFLKKENTGDTANIDVRFNSATSPKLDPSDCLTEKAAQVVLDEYEVERMLKAREKNRQYLNDELRIALIGKTGVGKSATANTIIGEDYFKSSIGLSAVTKTCAKKHSTVLGRQVLVVDTPGIFDTETDPDLIQQEIKRCISIASPGPHAILFVMTLSDRYKIEDYDAFITFCSYFGEKMLDHVIAVFTHGDSLQAKHITLDKCLEDSPPKLKELLKHFGNRKIAFNNTFTKVESGPQVECLLTIIESLKQANTKTFYKDKNFESAEYEIQNKEREIEEHWKQKFEAKSKQFRVNCEKELEKQILAMKKDWEKRVSELRKTIRDHLETHHALPESEKQSKIQEMFVQGLGFKLTDRHNEIEKKIPKPERRRHQVHKNRGDHKLETRCTEIKEDSD